MLVMFSKKKMKKTLFLIVHNIRSAHNVGAILRTADGAGVKKVYLTGYTPSPYQPGKDLALTGAQKELAKTALGAEKIVCWEKIKNLKKLIADLKKEKVNILALELSNSSKNIFAYKPRYPIALLIGNEVTGLDKKMLNIADETLFIPMRGKKESLNVSVAAGIAMYQLLK
jgi:23S rRNA (guanosine2251-2'-O)-methyltransferase